MHPDHDRNRQPFETPWVPPEAGPAQQTTPVNGRSLGTPAPRSAPPAWSPPHDTPVPQSDRPGYGPSRPPLGYGPSQGYPSPEGSVPAQGGSPGSGPASWSPGPHPPAGPGGHPGRQGRRIEPAPQRNPGFSPVLIRILVIVALVVVGTGIWIAIRLLR